MASPGTDSTQHLPQEASPSDQLAAIAHFLDELEAKTPIKHLQRETDGNKALLDTINSLIAVGAFIAGVQAQIVGIASDSNSRAIERATNWFAFVGLALDLIGTSTGVARALLLQAAMRRTHRFTARITAQIDAARHQLRELQLRAGRGGDLNLSTDAHAHAARASLASSVRAISRVVALLAEDGRFGVQSAKRMIEIEAAGEVALEALGSGSPSPSRPRPRPRPWWRWRSEKKKHGGGPHPLRALLWRNVVYLSNVHVEGLGHVPVVSLAGGTLCLLTSVVLFAATSQERGVWISCIAIAVSMLVCSVLPSNPLTRERAVLYDRVEETLQECPPVKPPVYSATTKGM